MDLRRAKEREKVGERTSRHYSSSSCPLTACVDAGTSAAPALLEISRLSRRLSRGQSLGSAEDASSSSSSSSTTTAAAAAAAATEGGSSTAARSLGEGVVEEQATGMFLFPGAPGASDLGSGSSANGDGRGSSSSSSSSSGGASNNGRDPGAWFDLPELPLELPVPRALRAHSVFSCPVSREVASASNPPVVLLCGHALCRNSVLNLARTVRSRADFGSREVHAWRKASNTN